MNEIRQQQDRAIAVVFANNHDGRSTRAALLFCGRCDREPWRPLSLTGTAWSGELKHRIHHKVLAGLSRRYVNVDLSESLFRAAGTRSAVDRQSGGGVEHRAHLRPREHAEGLVLLPQFGDEQLARRAVQQKRSLPRRLFFLNRVSLNRSSEFFERQSP